MPKKIIIWTFAIGSAAVSIFGVFKEYDDQYNRMISMACQGYPQEYEKDYGECKVVVQDFTDLYSKIKAKSVVEKDLDVVLECSEPNVQVGDHISFTWNASFRFASCLRTFLREHKGTPAYDYLVQLGVIEPEEEIRDLRDAGQGKNGAK